MGIPPGRPGGICPPNRPCGISVPWGFGVPYPVPVPVPVPVPYAPQSPPSSGGIPTAGFIDVPRAVLSTVQVPSASGKDPVFIDVIRGERGPSQYIPFTPPPRSRTAPAASLAATDGGTQAELQPGPNDSAQVLVRFLAHDDMRTQVQAANYLLHLGMEGRAQLADAVESPDPRTRAVALWSLGQISPTPSESDLILAGIKDESSGVRQQAILVAAGWGESAAGKTLEPLLAALSDSDEEVRQAAAEALPLLGETAIPPLVAKLGADREPIRAAAGQALILFGAPAVAPLTASLASRDAHVRYGAAFSLGEIGEPAESARPTLELLARNDPDANVRYYAVSAVRKLPR